MVRVSLILLLALIPGLCRSACNCGSTDQANPCTGQSISVTVTASTINGVNTATPVFNWAFNSGGGDARCGQFANGDYWVAPAAGQSSVTITGIATTSPGSITADADPVMESLGLLDGSKSYGNHNAAENIIPNLPISYSAMTSLVAAIQRNEAVEGSCGTTALNGECSDAYHVVTVLTSVPVGAGSTVIRPNISGSSKTMLSLADFDLTKIPSKSFLTGTNAAGLETIRQRWAHNTEIFSLLNASGTTYSTGGRAFRAFALVDDYAAGLAQQLNSDLMVLFSDDNTITEKQAAIAAIITYGHDLYNAMYNSGVTRYWGSGAGQHLGKFTAPAIMASLYKYSSFKSTLSTVAGHAHDNLFNGPQEMAQITRGANGMVWGDKTALTDLQYLSQYWSALWGSQCYDGATGTCNTNIGSKTTQDPHLYIDGPANKPGDEYMPVSLGPVRGFAAVMALLPCMSDVVNYESLMAYLDRVQNHGVQSGNDPCVTPDSRENLATCDAYRNLNCVYYGVTWGPVVPSNPASDCIKIPTPPYTKVGRFSALDGTTVNKQYTSPQVENNWAAIRALYQPAKSASLNSTGSATFGAGSLTIQ